MFDRDPIEQAEEIALKEPEDEPEDDETEDAYDLPDGGEDYDESEIDDYNAVHGTDL